MRIPNSSPSFLALSLKQRFFVSLWYRLTHPRSIDSYRVQLHNSRTAIRELVYHMGRPTTKPESLRNLAEECLQTIGKDPCLKDLLGFQLSLLEKRFKEALIELEDEKKAKNFNRQPLEFLAQDISSALECSYLKSLHGNLLREIAAGPANDYARLTQLTTSTVSDLIDRGWQLESLHNRVNSLLRENPTFQERLEYTMHSLTAEAVTFSVHLRLSGASKLTELEEFGDFRFRPDLPEVNLKPGKADTFTKADPQIVFASSTVQAVDYKSATHQALEKFEHCLDRIRFNFSRNKISPNKEMLVIRKDLKYSLEKISFEVPNPIYQFNAKRFKDFNLRLDQLIINPTIDPQTVECLQAATRHYRLGQDAESYKDKFLSWWFGIEYLTQGGAGGIGERTVRQASHLLMQRYIFWLLEDLIQSTKSELKTIQAGSSPKLSVHDFLALLQDNSFVTSLTAALDERPLLQARAKQLSDSCSDPAKMREFLVAHHQRISWQLDRLWGIRCGLVHGSPLAVRLLIPVSNMEFYLRECLIIALQSLDQNAHITSLDTIFNRAKLAWETTLAELKDPGADHATIRTMAFDSLAYHPNNSHS